MAEEKHSRNPENSLSITGSSLLLHLHNIDQVYRQSVI